MVEVTARLNRGPVYFAGETIKCSISFRNDTDRTHVLGWSGIQVYCHCVVDEGKVVLNLDRRGSHTSASESSSTGNSTSFNPSFGERGQPIFSTNPSILFCNLTLTPGQVATYSFQETIPVSAPPSYSGGLVKYLYKLTIGTQRVNSTVQLLKIPFKILTIFEDDLISDKAIIARRPSLNGVRDFESDTKVGGGEDFSSLPALPVTAADRNGATTNGDNGSTQSSVPGDDEILGYTDSDLPSNILDLRLHKLDCLTGRRSMNSYLITNPLGRVVRFCLLKNKFKLGEDIIGVFNFDESTVPCVQFSVSLHSEESIQEAHRPKATSSSGAYSVNQSAAKHHEVCLHTSATQMILPIPLTATPSFATSLVSLKWRLHFEFVTTTVDNFERVTILRDSQGVCEQSPPDLQVQTMTWDLPITIYPTHPVQVARGLHLPALSSLMI